MKSLQSAILRITDANNIHSEKAINKFFKDISEQYDGKLDEANKSNSNKKIEEEPLIEAEGQDNQVDPEDVQFRSILDKVIAQFPTRTTPSILRHSSSAKFEEPNPS